MEATIKVETVSIILTPFSNIDLESNTIVDQTKLEERVVSKDEIIKVFDRLENRVENIKVRNLRNKHWIYNEDRTFSKIIHVI